MQPGDRAPIEDMGGSRIEGINQHFLSYPLLRGALGTVALFNIVGGSIVIANGNHKSLETPAEAITSGIPENVDLPPAGVVRQAQPAEAIKPVPVTKPPAVPPKTRTATPKTLAAPVTTARIEPKFAPPAKTCKQLVREVRNIVPPPSGWQIICKGPNSSYDGTAQNGIISIYFGDTGDTEDHIRYVILHEIGHAYQKKAGMEPAFSVTQLENQADDFACAFNYCYYSGDKRGAVAICQMLTARYVRVC